MGACCGGRPVDEEINNAKDINEIIQIFEGRINKLPEERKELKEYLDDPTKQVGNLNLNDVDPEWIKKRIPHLENLEDAFGKVVDILKSNPELPLKDVKSYSSNVAQHYLKFYDVNDALKTDLDNMESFVNKWKSDNAH
jgi:hypothetical protein